MEIFRNKNESLGKTFQSFDQLLQAVRSHQKYRLALRNTKGACIPALYGCLFELFPVTCIDTVVFREIHLSDLIRAHEGNPDFHDEDPNKIHWAKFNMMGRFIDAITQCQAGIRATQQYNFAVHKEVRDRLLLDDPRYLMDEEVSIFPLIYLSCFYQRSFTYPWILAATLENVFARYRKPRRDIPTQFSSDIFSGVSTSFEGRCDIEEDLFLVTWLGFFAYITAYLLYLLWSVPITTSELFYPAFSLCHLSEMQELQAR